MKIKKITFVCYTFTFESNVWTIQMILFLSSCNAIEIKGVIKLFSSLKNITKDSCDF